MIAKISKLATDMDIFNPRKELYPYSVVCFNGKFYVFKRFLSISEKKPILLNKQGAERICSILNK